MHLALPNPPPVSTNVQWSSMSFMPTFCSRHPVDHDQIRISLSCDFSESIAMFLWIDPVHVITNTCSLHFRHLLGMNLSERFAGQKVGRCDRINLTGAIQDFGLFRIRK
jgi:hypothetical protein